jgi:hypothetical protein
LDGDQPGDVLILDPEKIGKRVPGFDMDKKIGRPGLDTVHEVDDEEPNAGDILVLDPRLDVIRPRVPGAPDFNKYTGREDPKRHIDEGEDMIVDFEGIDPIPNDPSQPRVRGHVDMGKADYRFKDNHDLDYMEEQEHLVIEPKLPDRKVKGFVDMGKAEERDIYKVKLHADPFYDEQPINELDNDIMGSLVKSTKPEPSAPDFSRYTNNDKNKNLPQIME